MKNSKIKAELFLIFKNIENEGKSLGNEGKSEENQNPSRVT